MKWTLKWDRYRLFSAELDKRGMQFDITDDAKFVVTFDDKDDAEAVLRLARKYDEDEPEKWELEELP